MKAARAATREPAGPESRTRADAVSESGAMVASEMRPESMHERTARPGKSKSTEPMELMEMMVIIADHGKCPEA